MIIIKAVKAKYGLTEIRRLITFLFYEKAHKNYVLLFAGYINSCLCQLLVEFKLSFSDVRDTENTGMVNVKYYHYKLHNSLKCFDKSDVDIHASHRLAIWPYIRHFILLNMFVISFILKMYTGRNYKKNCFVFVFLLQSAEFTWDKMTESLILSGFFYGYILLQLPGGWLSGHFGGKITIAVFVSIQSLLTLLTPALARLSPLAVFAARAVLGIFSVGRIFFAYGP